MKRSIIIFTSCKFLDVFKSQCHILKQFQPLREKLDLKETYRIDDIYKDSYKHEAAVSNYIQIKENKVKT